MHVYNILLDKELTAAKERQDIELAAQRATLQEQRKHIGILDKALQNAQHNSRCLEDEVCATKDHRRDVQSIYITLIARQN